MSFPLLIPQGLPSLFVDPELAYKYTTKGNLVAVITDGTAVLGLGNVGALAGKPVMEGRGVLFKQFAAIDSGVARTAYYPYTSVLGKR